MATYADDIKQLAGDSLLVLFGQVVTVGGGFLIHTLLIRNLTPSVFGILTLALTVVSIASSFAVVGMNQAVARFISGSESEAASDYIIIALSVVFGSSTLVAFLIWGLREEIGLLFSTPEVKNLLGLFIALIALRPLSNVLLGVVRGFEKTKWKIISSDILPFLISFPLIVYLIERGDVLLGAVVFYTVQPIVRIGLLSLNLQRSGDWQFRLAVPTRKKYSEVFSFAWPLAFETIVVVFMGSIDILMLGWFLDSAEVGYYRSIQPISKILIFFLQALTFIYLPIATRYFEQGKLEEIGTIYKASTRWITVATFPLLVFFVFFGKELLQVLFSSEYIVAWLSLAILSVGMYSRVITGPNGMTIKAINRTREDLLASVSALVTNISLNFMLIPRYGIAGAALATAMSYLVYNCIDLYIVYKYANIFPLDTSLLMPLIPTTILTIIFTQLVQTSGSSLIELVLLGVGISIVHLLSTILTTGFTHEDKVLLSNLRGGDE
ncbi:flippase [Halosegnis rubeus]|uniref:Oligosaccharide flippase family protein n=1 Tax=Halosegnis rubeus TaxID=2212850 RepID=A0A5N5UKS2_9EURY|nr:flippase [Halosegnis rubeus]KAB7517973.1 oligosaccharide flippase family protein [Halosegnis rubeus]